ncbi:MAG: HAMP domain-containing histidine kinase [Defluviitaleaceae bacterium]|nr:HAMP domain-containing histidine kinase [Defluviitaleaceae bacterium]
MKKYLPLSGLGFKTFIMALILMTAVMIMTLGILYRQLPRQYLNHITSRLDQNVDFLIQDLMQITDAEVVQQHIINFSTLNNAVVMSFDVNEQPLIEFTSLFTAANMPMLSIVTTNPDSTMADDIPYMTHVGYYDAQRAPVITGITPDGISHGQWRFIPASNINAIPLSISAYAGSNFMRSDEDITIVRAIQHPEIGYMAFSSTLQPIYQAQAVILAMIPYMAAAGFVVALIFALLFSQNFTKPIIKIADAASQMRQMTPGVVSGITSNDEVGRLSRTLDKLYQDLCANISELHTQMEKTAQLERSKTDLMRAAGHELKTPISALSGMLDGMIDKVGAYKNHEQYLPELKTQTQRLSKLVNEILVASKAGDVDNNMDITAVDIDAIIDETIQQHLPMVEKKELKLNIDPSQGFSYDTDRRVLLIVLSNLLSNAIKYAPQGGDINIGILSKDDCNVLIIENQCTHVDSSQISRWFEPFYTPEYSRDKSKGGTGLGLYIVKKNLDTLGLPFEINTSGDFVRFEIIFTFI